MEWRAVDQDIESLRDQHYVSFERIASGIGHFYLKQAGFDAADKFDAFRSRAGERNEALRDVLPGGCTTSAQRVATP